MRKVRFELRALVSLPLVRFRLQLDTNERWWVLVTGSILWAAAVIQQAGLQWTKGGNTALFGYLFLKEILQIEELVGTGLTLVAILFSQFSPAAMAKEP